LLAESFVTSGVSKAIIRDEELVDDTTAWGLATQSKATSVAVNLEKINKERVVTFVYIKLILIVSYYFVNYCL